jgi:hypothetical protein
MAETTHDHATHDHATHDHATHDHATQAGAGEWMPPPSGPGTVVLDIGGDIGAAVVTTPASLEGSEIEIRRHGDPWEGIHVAVRARHLPTGVTHAAVYESLHQGTYEIRIRGSHPATPPATTFGVTGGKVTTTQLPT